MELRAYFRRVLVVFMHCGRAFRVFLVVFSNYARALRILLGRLRWELVERRQNLIIFRAGLINEPKTGNLNMRANKEAEC